MLCVCFIYVAVPSMVLVISVINESINNDGDNVMLTLIWDEPFDNFNPILSYKISCSSQSLCPAAVTVYNTTSVNITNLMPRTMYTFSVIATNSIGDGEAGVLNITTGSSKFCKYYTKQRYPGAVKRALSSKVESML